MQTLADRLKEARIKADKTQGDVADAAGIRQPTYQALEAGKTKKSAYLPEIAKFLGVDVDWLKNGTVKATPSKPRDGQPMMDVKFRGVEFWDGDTPLNEDEFEVPYYKDIELTGGCGSFEQHDDGRRRIKYGKTAAYSSGASQTQSICMTLVGDSMEDRISAGSMIAVDLSKRDIREGKIYAFRHGQLLRVKYLIPKPDGGLIIRSHNKAYEDEHINAEEVENDINMIGWVWNWSVLERW
ncbi:helix-turn-helix transcriptional regulator [Acinetobacter sp. WCHAc060033]|uniref:XRE family transcriptional regulator n=1 Tax=Acinetobacter sp. WCHAc060033 TaxID=2518624 RepID=UPI001023395B|nr:S24 family peptidase [Acinetobacter sp. WCHAc060033]RZG74698.1 helix-turn-helix transcriptional regulator [Acinetobacter sp. WCHAc060033]